MEDIKIDANKIPFEQNDFIKYIAGSLIAIILNENLEKEEIMDTLRLWKNSGWHKNA